MKKRLYSKLIRSFYKIPFFANFGKMARRNCVDRFSSLIKKDSISTKSKIEYTDKLLSVVFPESEKTEELLLLEIIIKHGEPEENRKESKMRVKEIHEKDKSIVYL